ncbi:MAG: type II secretion system protein, partial [Planctomycetales bacterium]|nr:type II secretion system protein [Planctomycetales bacterium]
MIVHLRPLPRAAYTLLELMIALGLLGMLLSVAWSLMGTYRDAEQRGWKVARRTQVIRAARSWLESDMQHVLLSDSPSQVAAARSGGSPAASGLSGVLPTAPPGAASANWRFVGNAQGFSATIAPSLDPLPFLERLMTDSLGASSAPESLAAGSSAAGSSAAGSSAAGPLAASQGPTDL